jgi:hypothetical protein
MAQAPALRSVAVAAIAAAWFAVIAASGGCEVAVGSAVPGFACIQGHDVCPNGQVCDPNTNRCVTSCMSSGCKAGTCDPNQGICVTADSGIMEAAPGDTSMPPPESSADTAPPPDTFVAVDTGMPETVGPCRSLGCPCSGAAACDSQICADSLTVTPALFAAAGSTSFCTQGCCTSADCDANTVCFATGQGGSYCVDPAWLMRATGVGGGQGGAPCATARDCRSALCDTGAGKCVDTCCSSMGAASACATGETCQFAAFPGTASFDKAYSAFCAPPPGNKQDGATCFQNSDCAANLCASVGGGGNTCHGACRNETDCGSGESCSYVLPPGQTTNPMPVVASCFTSTGTLTQGVSCNPMMDMCEGFCHQLTPTTGLCTDPCFTNSDCTVSMWRCRPEVVSVQAGGSYSVLACGT